MAYDKVIDSSALDANLASIAEAIRTKGGTTDQLVFPDGFISAIEAIQAGGGGGGGLDYGTITTTISSGIKIEHGLGAVPQALIFIALSPENVANTYNEAPLYFLLPKKGEASSRLFFYRRAMQRAQLSASGTNSLFGSGTSNTTYDRVNNINDSYFVTPTSIGACTYFWAVFKEALI